MIMIYIYIYIPFILTLLILNHSLGTVISQVFVIPFMEDPKNKNNSMVVEMVPLKGGIGSIFHPTEGKDYPPWN